MKQSSIAEFSQFRFIRDRDNSVITLPSQGIDERNLLVLDCERWGLARLHIFEDAAKRRDKLEAFQEEMQTIALMCSRSVVRITTWGRDESELFYASEMQDGEPLPAYLDRTTGVPFSVAAEWMIQMFSLLDSAEVLTPSFERFTTLNFQVIVDHFGVVRPVFSEFYGWTRPGAHVREHPLDWYLAQIFCSLIAGVPVRTFHRNSLPRNFEKLDQSIQEAVLNSLEEISGDSYEQFKSAMSDLSGGADKDRSGVALPLMPVREWLRGDLQKSYDGEAEYHLPADPDPLDELYAIPTRIRGKAANVQILPGLVSIPREEWLNQHHDATRKPGWGTINQLQVNYVEDRDSLTLVGEERVDGLDLASLVRENGARSETESRAIATKVCAAIDLLEQNVGSCCVWWLPPENIVFLTGTLSRELSGRLVEIKGIDGWEDFPIKLRLHQTTATLRHGVNLPPAVRRLSREPGRGFRAARRSAILLPLIWSLLAGSRMRWAKPVERIEGVSTAFTDLFEKYRIQLREDPEGIETDFLDAMAALTPEVPAEPKPDDTSARHEKGEAALEAAFDATLYDGDIDLNAETLKEPDPATVIKPEETSNLQQENSFETGERNIEPEKQSSDSSKSGAIWLWAALAGAVSAAVVGYGLSDWNERQSLYEVEPEIEFPHPSFEFSESASSSRVVTDLQNFLIAEGGPQNLKVLQLLKVFDLDVNRVNIENALRVAVKDRKPEAARLMGDLSRIRGDEPEAYRLWMLEAAKMGDAESQYRYANEILGSGIEGEARAEATAMLGLAAAAGHDSARELWAVTVMDTDPVEAHKAIESAAANGVASSLFTLGVFQADGVGTIADKAAAAASFKKAAGLGDVRAMYWFARCLEVGYGVETSFTEARRWMKNAAQLGSGKAALWCREREIPVTGAVDPTGSSE